MNLSNLTCFDLDQPAPGFQKFISSWLYRGDGFTFLVDPGPLSTIPLLLGKLRDEGVTRLDYVILTHIHIDHAGGAGELIKHFPEAVVICHPEGIRHLAAPQKLWEGSRMVLGALAEMYGEIVPVPADRIRFEETIGRTGLRAYLTPGHALHHCCYLLDDLLLFAGEAAGVRCEVPGVICMRPATPPRFILDVALDSIDRMIALSPRYMVFGHYGLVDSAVDYLQRARKQLLLWVKGVAETMTPDGSPNEEAFVQWLRERDEFYRNMELMLPDVQEVDRSFLGNTMRGLAEFLQTLSPTERKELLSKLG